MRWVEVVEVVVVAAVPVAALDAVPVEWAVPRPPVRAVPVSARVAGTGSPTRWESPVTRRSARSAARRWCVNSQHG